MKDGTNEGRYPRALKLEKKSLITNVTPHFVNTISNRPTINFDLYKAQNEIQYVASNSFKISLFKIIA